MENKEIKIVGKIVGKDEIIEKVKLKQKKNNQEKHKFFEMNKQIEEEHKNKIVEEMKKKLDEKMQRSEAKHKQDLIKAKLAKEINSLRKIEQELNLKSID